MARRTTKKSPASAKLKAEITENYEATLDLSAQGLSALQARDCGGAISALANGNAFFEQGELLRHMTRTSAETGKRDAAQDAIGKLRDETTASCVFRAKKRWGIF